METVRISIKILLCYNEIGVASQISSIGGGPSGQEKFITYPMEMQVPYRFHSEIPEESTVWEGERRCKGDTQYVVQIQRCGDYCRRSVRGSCTSERSNPAQTQLVQFYGIPEGIVDEHLK